MGRFEVFLEVGKKYTFACAVDWPGWCRRGRSPEEALQALVDYGPRFARVLEGTRLGFSAPAEVEALQVVETLPGNAITDFGAPDAIPTADLEPLDAADARRYAAIMQAVWAAFDASLASAQGKELRKGPRGGGRDQEKIQQHVLGGDVGYLRAAGWKFKDDEARSLSERIQRCRLSILDLLPAAVAGELPDERPRGGKTWPPRYYVRRAAWHTLDHAWEIEDRILVG